MPDSAKVTHARLVETVHTELVEETPDDTPATVVVAWSGGADSTVLLDILDRLRGRGRLELLAVHVDHRVRDGASRDAAWCRHRAAARGMPLRVRRLDPAPDSLDHQAARTRRYTALADEADRVGADLVATGHHARDAVETALLHFARGAGSEGISSLMRPSEVSRPPVPHWPDVSLVRPLRTVAPTTLQKYAETRSLDWVEDPTNTADSDSRHRLQQHVLDELGTGAGSLDSMVDSVRNLADEATDRRRRARRSFDDIRVGPDAHGRVVLDTSAFADLAPSLAAAVVEEALDRLPGAIGWNRAHLLELVDIARRVDTPDVDWPRRVTMRATVASVDDRRIVFERTDGRGAGRVADRRASPATIRVDRDGDLPWFDHRLEWRLLEPDDPGDFPTEAATAWLDRNALGDELIVRSPRPGESFAPIGGPSTTVTETLRAAEVPPTARWNWPVLAAPPADLGDCLWVAGARQADAASVDGSTEQVLELTLAKRE